MISLSKTYSVNRQQVVHDTIDGEVVSINLESGNYYSMNDLAAEIWNWIHAEGMHSKIVRRLYEQYDGNPSEMADSLERFIQQLLEEGLIREIEAKNTELAMPSAVKARPSLSSAQKKPFVAPKLEKYTDMQEFLLVDPIHEVDEEGWPHKKSSSNFSPS